MPAQAVATPYLRRPHLRQSDFLIGEKPNESRYVPSSLVPTEIEGNIHPTRLNIIFRYITPESPSSKKFRHRNAQLELGRSTKKILQVSIVFEPNHNSLIRAIDEAIKAIKLAKAGVTRPSLQKSYNIISEFLEQARTDFLTDMRRELEEMFRQAPNE